MEAEERSGMCMELLPWVPRNDGFPGVGIQSQSGPRVEAGGPGYGSQGFLSSSFTDARADSASDLAVVWWAGSRSFRSATASSRAMASS